MSYEAALGDAIRALELALIRALPEPDESVLFGSRMYDSARFLKTLEWLSFEAPGRRFLDVGCGIGTKLVLAHHMGWEATGIEVRPEYIELAHRIYGDLNILLADARNWKLDYAAFDVVYLYSPFRDQAMEHELEDHIAAHLRSGALLWVEGHNLIDRPGLRGLTFANAYAKL